MYMKYLRPLFLSLCLCIACQACEKERISIDITKNRNDDPYREEPDDRNPDPEGTFDYSRLGAMDHPRLLMTQTDFDALKEKVEAGDNEIISTVHTNLLKIAEDNLPLIETDPIVYGLEDSKRMLVKARKSLQRLWNFSYAWKMTGEQKYLDQVNAYLKAICSFPDWNSQRHFLDTGEWALGVAIAYDWCYSDLDFETRALVHKSLRENAIEKAFTKDAYNFETSEGNWNSVCYCGCVAAAIAIYEKDKSVAAQMIEKAVENNRFVLGSYGPDGIYPEGYSYWKYGTEFEVIMLSAMEKVWGNAAGLDNYPGLDKTGEFMLYAVTPSEKTFNYSDNTIYTDYQYAQWYFARKFNRPELLVRECQVIDSGTYASTSYMTRCLPFVACIISSWEFSDKISYPEKALFSGLGNKPLVIVRTAWENTPEARYLGAIGGYAKQSHAHMDAGSFIYEAGGVRWSNDIPYQGYVPLEDLIAAAGGHFWNMEQSSLRWQAYRWNNRAHSTLTVNDKDHFVNAPGAVLEKTIDTDSEKGGVFDMTAVLDVASARRTVKLVDGDYAVIIDEITAKSSTEAKVQWRMATEASCAVGTDGITLTQDGQTLRLSASSVSVLPSYTTWEAKMEKPNTWDAPNPTFTIVGHTFTVPAGQSATVTTTLKLQ